MDWFVEPLSIAFIQRALVAGLAVGALTAIVGTWIVLRGMTFMGDALAHGVLPGLTIAYLNGANLFLGAAIAAGVMIGGIGLVHRRARLPEDVGIGLLFVGMLALGVVVASRAQSYAGDLTALLFGDILGVTRDDIWTALAALVVVGIASVALHRAFIVLAFSEQKARSLGLRPALAHAAMLVLLAGAIITSFRAVGVLLVFAFIVAPPATAAIVVRRVPTMMAVAVVASAVSVLVGLLVSYHLGTAASATMTAVAVAEFFVVLAARDLRRAVSGRVA